MGYNSKILPKELLVFDVKGQIISVCFLGISWKVPCIWIEEFNYSHSHNQVTLFHETFY
jgi:hypothetical protein